jgi:hypothetical protein
MPPFTTPLTLQRHLVSRSTLQIFRAEAAYQWRDAVASARIAHPACGSFLLTTG